jgi:nucleotide-binding universal stress UspA family protein
VERRRLTHAAELTERRREAQVYRKILVALDGSDAARAAFVFASDWARHFDSELWFIQLTEESHGPRRDIVTDVRRRGRQRANHFAVSGVTRGRRNQQLVRGIAGAASTFGADMIIVGLEGRRLGRAHFAESVREQLTAATSVPVLVAPKHCVARIPAAERHQSAIALGPAPSGSVLAGAAMAHV